MASADPGGPRSARPKTPALNALAAGLLNIKLAPALLTSLCIAAITMRTGRNEFLTSVGEFLIAGIPNNAVTYKLPLFDVARELLIHLGTSPGALTAAFYFPAILAAFSVAALLGGNLAGIIAAAGAAYFAAAPQAMELEQAAYAAALLLVQYFLLLRSRQGGISRDLLLGLAIAVSLMIRSALLLFPAAVLLCDWHGRLRGRKFVFSALALVAASYALLIPWLYADHYCTGSLHLPEAKKAECNLTTAAAGAVYTMEGNFRNLRTDHGSGPGILRYYLREAGRSPFKFLLYLLRRLWHIFLMHPSLYLLFFSALAFSHRKNRTALSLLPAYFVGIHSIASIDSRYFIPMTYLLPALSAGIFLGRTGLGPSAEEDRTGPVAKSLLWISLAACAFTAVLLLRFPARAGAAAGDKETFRKAARSFPRTHLLAYGGCRELWRDGAQEEYLSCLMAYGLKFGKEQAVCFAAAAGAGKGGTLPAVPDYEFIKGPCHAARLLSELQQNDYAAARNSLTELSSATVKVSNMIRGKPYARDRELAELISRDRAPLEMNLYMALINWQPAQMRQLLGRLNTIYSPAWKIKELENTLRSRETATEEGDAVIRQEIFSLEMFKSESATFKTSANHAPSEGSRFMASVNACLAAGPGTRHELALANCDMMIFLAASAGLEMSAGKKENYARAAYKRKRELLLLLGREQEASEIALWEK